ncbi:MAG TPA: hypothetical protein GXX53_04170 [Tissierellia bacterium]|nr:hypothetical protein [Tissierellia bacterium]
MKMRHIKKYLVLLIIGGNLYYILEVLWRGYSHFTMFMLGGICFILVGLINEISITSNMPLIIQQFIAAIIITSLELVFGLVFNIWLGLNIWDYSSLRFNFMGQICLMFSILWFFLSLPAILLDDYLRYWIFGEEKPEYRYIGFNRKRV